MEERQFLDFYNKHKIIPVAQEINQKHLSRRQYLYRTLGLNQYDNDSKIKILEIGPGTGDNAVATNKIFNSQITFIDGNQSSISAINAKIKNGILPIDTKIINYDFLEYSSKNISDDSKFQLVLCEGTIPGQNKPKLFADKVLQFVASEGRAVFTCADVFSLLPELLRRLWRPHLIKLEFKEAIKKGVEIFKPHLKNLPEMSRSYEDWVADQILNTWAKRGWQFSVSDAIETAQKNDMFYLGSSPSFVEDWIWYKEALNTPNYYNQLALKEWENKKIFLLDKRLHPISKYDLRELNIIKFSDVLYKISNFVSDVTCVDDYEYSEKDFIYLDELISQLIKIIKKGELSIFLEETLKSIVSFKRYWKNIYEGIDNKDEEDFQRWWGRGTVYLSFEKSRLIK